MIPHDVLINIIGRILVRHPSYRNKPVGYFIEHATDEEKEILKGLTSADIENVRKDMII